MQTTTFPKWEELSEREQLLCIASDLGKEFMGMRPRWISSYTVEELKETIADWRAGMAAEAQMEKDARDRYSRAKSQALKKSVWKIGNFFDNSLAPIGAR